ncbi:MAG: hypothetical protein KF889_03615 [Alphaproteobacteria bacterium]|nr:hypothetical protein [Alphaproteobacteria bacterium]MCW5741998.1 hypothetical protein [Alphaproteobacteria bacterium]
MTMQDGGGASQAIADLYNALMTGVVLSLVTRRGSDTAREFVFRHFRRQHLEKFKPGLVKLGLDGLPHAVACAQYHYLSNAVGGVKTEYVLESDRKVWVRYPPPRWIWRGTAVCAVPHEVNAAMLHGWHGHNGVSLGNPRLGFVCTGMITTGAPGLEGYYCEYDRDLAEHERVRFVDDETMPRFDAAQAPTLDVASWPQARLHKVYRSYAMEYVRSLLPTLLELIGAEGVRVEVGRAARLVGMQYFDECAARLGGETGGFGAFLASLLAAQGEDVTPQGARVVQRGWKLMRGVELGDDAQALAAFDAWNGLWQGALAASDRFLRLETHRRRDGDDWVIEWRVQASGR